ncbi:MAG TPA: hypothetical protein VLA58_02555 [Chitinophagaceae bacterium]|nr:hypothetical protein [Chitinophagaceae bacterium]
MLPGNGDREFSLYAGVLCSTWHERTIPLYTWPLFFFYVYPLKFLFSLLLHAWTGINMFPKAIEQGEDILKLDEFPQLVVIFSAGYFMIWMVLYLMHVNAIRLSAALQLSTYELLYTKKEQTGAFWNALVGLAAITLSFTSVSWLPGMVYLLIPMILLANEWFFRRSLRGLGYAMPARPLYRKQEEIT